MKRFLKIFVLLSILALSVFVLASCMGSYKDKLESEGYEIKNWDADDISSALNALGAPEHDIKEAFSATKGISSVYVLKLGTSSKASDLASDIDADYLTVEVKGNIVLIGSSDAVSIAIN